MANMKKLLIILSAQSLIFTNCVTCYGNSSLIEESSTTGTPTGMEENSTSSSRNSPSIDYDPQENKDEENLIANSVPHISNGELGSGLQNLLSKQAKFRNKSQNTNSTEGISFNHLLGEVKSVIQNISSTYNQTLLTELVTNVDQIKTSVDECKSDNVQKMNLVMENFSTLKFMLTSHESRIMDNAQQILAIKSQFVNSLLHSTEDECSDPSKNATSEHKMLPETTDSLSEGKRLVEGVQTEISSLHEKVENNTKQIANLSQTFNLKTSCSYHGRLNVSEQNENQPSSSELLSRLLKSTIESFRKEVSDLQAKVNSLSGQVNVSQELRDTPLNQSEEASELLVASNYDAHPDVSTKLANFEEDLLAVRDLRDEVAELRRMIETQQSNASQDTLCVWPFKPSSDGCFFVNTEERLGWVAARGRCKELQGDLASPRNFESFRQFLVTQRLSRSYSFWVSANDQNSEGQWRWVDGRKVPQGVWASGQPNKLRSANCMEIRPGFKFVGADEDCRDQKYFVCQQRGS